MEYLFSSTVKEEIRSFHNINELETIMTISDKIKLLERLLEKVETIKKEDSDDPDFKIWKDLVERTFIKVFGDDSPPIKQFKKLRFYKSPFFSSKGTDYTDEHLKSFRRDFHIAKKTIDSLIEELQNELENQKVVNMQTQSKSQRVNKVFISHSSMDKEIVEELIELIETIGVNSTQIFCSSFSGYGIDLGENFLTRLKEELDENILVLFVLSKNFYASPISLCEMGATWIKTNEHIPILIPPFDFNDIQGVIPQTQGFKINESLKLNLFKEKIEQLFCLKSIDNSTWERKRDKILKRISQKLN